jgi:hypothetical protein
LQQLHPQAVVVVILTVVQAATRVWMVAQVAVADLTILDQIQLVVMVRLIKVTQAALDHLTSVALS